MKMIYDGGKVDYSRLILSSFLTLPIFFLFYLPIEFLSSLFFFRLFRFFQFLSAFLFDIGNGINSSSFYSSIISFNIISFTFKYLLSSFSKITFPNIACWFKILIDLLSKILVLNRLLCNHLHFTICWLLF